MEEIRDIISSYIRIRKYTKLNSFIGAICLQDLILSSIVHFDIANICIGDVSCLDAKWPAKSVNLEDRFDG